MVIVCDSCGKPAVRVGQVDIFAYPIDIHFCGDAECVTPILQALRKVFDEIVKNKNNSVSGEDGSDEKSKA